MNAIQKYNTVREFIALLIGPYGKKILANNPELKQLADKVSAKLQPQALDELLKLSPACSKMFTDLVELRELRKLTPETSFDTTSAIKDAEAKLVAEMQNALDYDPLLFYDIYFLTLGLKQEYAKATPLVSSTRKDANFALWIGGTKVLDEHGAPLIVYHGTSSETEFTKFQFNIFPGAYFAENKSYSDWFAKFQGKGHGYECYLRVINPIDLTSFKLDKVKYEDFVAYIELRYGYKLPHNPMLKAMSDAKGGDWVWRYLRGGVDWLKLIKEKNEFDGFVYYENNPDDQVKGKENTTKAWLVLDAKQIKSAYGNLTYNINSDDIRMKEGGTV